MKNKALVTDSEEGYMLTVGFLSYFLPIWQKNKTSRWTDSFKLPLRMKVWTPQQSYPEWSRYRISTPDRENIRKKQRKIFECLICYLLP